MEVNNVVQWCSGSERNNVYNWCTGCLMLDAFLPSVFTLSKFDLDAFTFSSFPNLLSLSRCPNLLSLSFWPKSLSLSFLSQFTFSFLPNLVVSLWCGTQYYSAVAVQLRDKLLWMQCNMVDVLERISVFLFHLQYSFCSVLDLFVWVILLSRSHFHKLVHSIPAHSWTGESTCSPCVLGICNASYPAHSKLFHCAHCDVHLCLLYSALVCILQYKLNWTE